MTGRAACCPDLLATRDADPAAARGGPTEASEGAMAILLAGAAGFIGYHVAERLLAGGERVVRIDNLNTYYDSSLKRARLARLAERPGFHFSRADIADRSAAANRRFGHASFPNLRKDLPRDQRAYIVAGLAVPSKAFCCNP
jgi:nucleoside-diphosphate-sugar epimerase